MARPRLRCVLSVSIEEAAPKTPSERLRSYVTQAVHYCPVAETASFRRARDGRGGRQERQRDAEVEEIPTEPIEKRGLVGAREIEDHARHRAAERHAEDGRHQHDTDAHTRLVGREEFADDHRVRGYDPA